MSNQLVSFREWMNLVDGELSRVCGLNHFCLADQPFRDWYDDDMPPEDAAHECLVYEGFPGF